MRVFTNTEGVDVGRGWGDGGGANISMFDILQPSLFTRWFNDKIEN